MTVTTTAAERLSQQAVIALDLSTVMQTLLFEKEPKDPTHLCAKTLAPASTQANLKQLVHAGTSGC